MKRRLVRFFKSNSGILLAVCTLFLATGLLVAGPTLAFFTSQDEVTNRVQAYAPEIELIELNWVTSGQADAKSAVPGDEIAKDPAVYNTSDAAVYVRMKIQVMDENGDDITTTERGKAILNALYVEYTDSTTTPLFYTVDYDTDPSTLASNNQYFYYYDEDTATSTYDGWFYYVTGTASYTAPTTNTTLAVLDPGETTATLLEKLVIPVFKSEYVGTFDEYYDIVVTAQAIADETLDVNDFDAVVAAFEAQYES